MFYNTIFSHEHGVKVDAGASHGAERRRADKRRRLRAVPRPQG